MLHHGLIHRAVSTEHEFSFQARGRLACVVFHALSGALFEIPQLLREDLLLEPLALYFSCVWHSVVVLLCCSFVNVRVLFCILCVYFVWCGVAVLELVLLFTG